MSAAQMAQWARSMLRIAGNGLSCAMPSGEEHARRDRICRKCGLVGRCRVPVFVTICSRIGVPGIVGYILAGIVIGPRRPRPDYRRAALSSIGEIGVIPAVRAG